MKGDFPLLSVDFCEFPSFLVMCRTCSVTFRQFLLFASVCFCSFGLLAIVSAIASVEEDQNCALKACEVNELLQQVNTFCRVWGPEACI